MKSSKKSERNKELDYITKTIQLKDFTKNFIKKVISDKLRYQQNTRKVCWDYESGIKLYSPYERGVTERMSRISKRLNIKLVNTNTTSLKPKIMINTMNQRNEIEIQAVVDKVKYSECNSIYTEEIERLDKHKQDANKVIESNISGLSRHVTQIT